MGTRHTERPNRNEAKETGLQKETERRRGFGQKNGGKKICGNDPKPR
jgi:hypothetical protein